MTRLVLASASPRRRAYLQQLGVPHEVIAAEIDECRHGGEAPEAMALRLAGEKARAVVAIAPRRWILAADTVVAIDDQMLGKPACRDGARRMLQLLAGREHRVVTGVVLLEPDGQPAIEEIAVTRVRFRVLAAAEIDAYLATGEADDKAGAYGIQGAAAPFVAGIDGSFSNVVGLPLEIVEPALRRAGLLS